MKTMTFHRYNPPTKNKNLAIRTLFGLLVLVLRVSGQSPLFMSGFEGNSTLEAIPSSATSDYFQHFSGLDTTTGYTWPMNFWGAYAVTTGMHPIVAGSNAVSSYINNYIETVPGHTGSATRALRMNITGPAPGFCCIQSTFQVAGMTQQVTDFYTRYWVKLNPEFLTQVQSNLGNFWRTLLELKTFTDYRIATFIVGNDNGVPSWRVIVDNDPNGTLPPCPAGACWTANNSSIPVPTTQWFLMEYYLHRSTGNDGRFFWAVNGKTLVDHYGPTYGANQENIDFLGLLNLYGDGNNMSPAYNWVDDVEVWNLPPCATLPCGAAPDTQAPTTPTNLTGTAVSSSQINLSWNVSTDNVSVAGYMIYRNGGTTPIAKVSGTTYQDTGLTASTTYTYRVAAYDAAGNTSPLTAAASATTASVTPPTISASVSATAGTRQSAVINSAYATALQATVKDASSNPLSGVTVTFTAPGSGASGTFGGAATATAVTNASGIATAPAFTANAVAGGFTVTATVAGVATPANFSLTNTAASTAITRVQGCNAGRNGAGPVVCTMGSNITVGNYLVASIVTSDSGKYITGVTHGTDICTQTPKSPYAKTQPAAGYLQLFVCPNVATTGTTISFAFSASMTSNVQVFVVEYSGLATSSTIDQAPAGTQGSSSAIASTAAVTTQAKELLVGVTDSSRTPTATGTYAIPTSCPSPSACTANAWWNETYWDAIVNATGSYQIQSTNSLNWSALAVSIR